MNRSPRRTGRRWLTRLAGFLIAVLVVSGLANTAHAVDICKDPPAPVGPKSGLSGLFTLKPQQPAPADPFADPQVPIADAYGYNWNWAVYDLGCSPGSLADPVAVFNTTNANMVMSFANTNLAVLGLLERFAKDSGISWFTTWVSGAAKSIQPIVFGGDDGNGGALTGLLPMAAIALGLFLVWRARKADYAATLKAALMLLVCTGLAAWTLIFPAAASSTMDAGIRQVATISGGAFNASLTDGVNRQGLYRSWLAGQFGDPDSDLAKANGPKLMEATHYTWAEWDQIEQDPKAREAIDKRKADSYKKIAEEVKEANPAAYVTFQGRGDRVGPALFGVVVGLVMGLFAMIAYFMILVGRVLMQVLVVIVPVGAVVGVLPRGYGVLMRMWDLFTAAVLTVAKFTFAAGLMSTLLGLLATLDPVSSLLWMSVVTVIAFWILRPGREFKRLIPGLDPNRNYLREGAERLASAAIKVAGIVATGGATAAAAGGGAAAGSAPPAPEPPAPAPQRVDVTRADQTRTEKAPLPAPQWAQIEGTHRHIALTDQESDIRALPAGPGRWSGVIEGEVVSDQRALPAATNPADSPGNQTPTPGTPGLGAVVNVNVHGNATDVGHSVQGEAGPGEVNHRIEVGTPGTGMPAGAGPGRPGGSNATGSHPVSVSSGGVNHISSVSDPRAGESASDTTERGPAWAATQQQATYEVRVLQDNEVSPGVTVVEGELMDDSGIYRSTSTDDVGGDDGGPAHLSDASGARDRGSDQPGTELVLYRSGRSQ